jgi:hypothetical protein
MFIKDKKNNKKKPLPKINDEASDKAQIDLTLAKDEANR